MKILRRIVVTLSVLLFVLLGSYRLFTSGSSDQGSKEEVLLQLMIGGLNSAHYQPLALNDTFSDRVYKIYLQRLDFNKKFLLQEDVDKLARFRYQVDDQINGSLFEFFELSDKMMTGRVKESEQYYKEILQQPMNFTADESIELDGEKLKFPRTKEEMKEAWRKAMKYQVMTRLAGMIESQEKAKERKDTAFKEKTMAEMEVESRKAVLKSNDEIFRRISKQNREDRLDAYLNSIVSVYDPHTEFFPPADKKNFDISMTGRLEGIGAQLQEREGQIRVAAIVPGSASWRDGKLKAGDVIIKVGQGSSDPVDVEGMRIEDVVALIRGKKGTEVRLTVKKPDGVLMEIPIIRDIVVLSETYAQSAVLKGKNKVGYIRLPSFYGDLNNEGTPSCAEDVRKELIKLQNEKVEAVILDLRDNGGGSLHDVIKMAGLFIRTGPIVQVKEKEGKPRILSDHDTSIVYRGPLVVMVNGNSASASEILAAAIQDYRRGVIAGSHSTFGKGTVQRFIRLDDYVMQAFDKYKPLGELKLTIQKFYRVNGGTTQLKGVLPDVVFPDIFSAIETGEKELDYPLAWDNIAPADYTGWTGTDVDGARKKSEKRISDAPLFKLAKEQSDYYKKQRDDTQSTLNLEKYRAEIKENREKTKKFEEITKEIKEFDVLSTSEDEVIALADSVKLTRRTDWFKNIRKDIYIQEAMNISGDMKR